ncbi:hypothetical protein [Pseudomonas sp. R5(2019)]|uniref:hypothetical protein n=1 Tax=Pseudomonas sp. R5(2019) TaxID=2697566 RepID=UPI00141354F3|nr:hypothetical protein [Pseudomonas sp. R5(2019)]NBA98479.1 hypothetical protein [Pseudomonas sp. R5(2019)]
MNRILGLALAITVGWMAGCATRPQDSLDVTLNPSTYNSGKIAQASLTAAGDETSISLIVGGVPNGTVRPVHLYTYIYPGSCEKPGPQPAYEMNQTVGTDLKSMPPWQMWKRAPVPLSQLRSGAYALVVRAAPMDGNRDLFCGNIQ